jgi:hypothetical protein
VTGVAFDSRAPVFPFPFVVAYIHTFFLLGLPEEPGLITTSGDLLKGGEAEVLQLDPIRSDPPLLVFGRDVLSLQFLEEVSRSLDPSERRIIPRRSAG